MQPKGGIKMKINLSSFLQRPFNIFMCRLLGWKFTLHYIAFLGKIYFFFNRKEKSKITQAVQTVFSDLKQPADIRTIVQEVFRGILSHYYEKFFNAFSQPETLRALIKTHMQCEDMTAIQKGLANGKGVLLITGHLGQQLPGNHCRQILFRPFATSLPAAGRRFWR